MIEYRHNNVSGIYMIRSCINGKIYIGSAKNLYLRKHIHVCQLRGEYHFNIHLQRHSNKYGAEKMMFFIIEYCDIDILVVREQYWIDILKPEFNIMPNAGSHLGFKYTDESKEKMRQVKLGKKASEETKRKMSEVRKGRKQTEEWKRKIKESRKLTQKETNLKISKANKGRKHTEEEKLKMREGCKNRVITGEWKHAISVSLKKYWDEKKRLELESV